MIILGCDGLTMSFGERDVLSNVSFSVQEGDRVGIVGENGAGKTSLLKMITGEYEGTGSVFISKDKTVGMLSQNAVTDEDGTVYSVLEDTFSDLKEREAELDRMRRRIDVTHAAGITLPDSYLSDYTAKLESFSADGGDHFRGLVKSYLIKLGFPEQEWDKPAGKLSGGQKTRLALGKLIIRPPDILLLDEPTNHLDIQTLGWLEDVLSNLTSTLLVVSHDRYFLDRVATKILDIDNGRARLYDGNYTKYTEKKKTDREIQRRHYENQQKEIARLEAFIEQQKRWNRERNIIAAESRRKAIDRMEKVEAPEAERQGVRMRFTAGSESGNDVLTVTGLSKRFGDQTLFSGVSFLIKRGDRAFVVGHNGSGKSTLMKILRGKLAPSGGTYEFGYNVSIGYYDQENQELNDENTVLDEVWSEYGKRTQTEIRSALALFLFRGDDVNKKVGMLSGGEKARLTFVKLILRSNNVLLLDEPTIHLDIKSREALEDALAGYGGTLIAVSHDRYFVNKLCTRVLDISATPFADYHGTYTDYLRYSAGKAQSAAPAQVSESKQESRRRYEEERQNRSERRKLASRIERAKKETAETEAALEQLEADYKENELDYKKLMELDVKRAELEEKLMSLYEQTDRDEREFAERFGE
ncbi:MAG: ATP-binding cassette domain-containing protein [Clostridia bacterium]|nr:ATP-binding cassette domain-containing protein [Clostridia bacterium]